MTARFVILHHRTADGEHWDLMLERGEVLVTWQLQAEPLAWFETARSCPDPEAIVPLPVRRIGDHRKVYLEYEGPLTGGRGQVRRVVRGFVEIDSATEDGWVFSLSSGQVSGRFRLLREAEQWTLQPVSSA